MRSAFCFSAFISFCFLLTFGCGEEVYYSQKLGVEVKKIDYDLNGRWSLQGVVVSKVEANSPSSESGLEVGEIISYLIGEKAVKNKRDFKSTVKEALKNDGRCIFNLEDRQVEVAVRKRGDSLKLKVEGNRIAEVEPGGPADSAGLKTGDVILSITDEKLVASPKEFKKAVKKVLKYDSTPKLKTADLSVVKLAAVDALGRLNDVRAIDPLIAAAESEDRWLRQRAVKALENLSHTLEDERLVDLMVKHLSPDDEPDAEVRKSSAAILGQIKDEKSVEPLIKALSDPTPSVRFIAGTSLAKLGTPATKALAEALKSPNSNVREVAASALGEIGGVEARKALTQAANDEEIVVKLTVLDALAKVGDAESVKTLKEAAQTSDGNIKYFVEQLLSKLSASL